VAATIAVGGDLTGVAMTPDGAYAYGLAVLQYGLRDQYGDECGRRHGFRDGTAVGIVITPSGVYAYVTLLLTGNVAVIDTATNTLAATVPTGEFRCCWTSRSMARSCT
jgi:YVTN family beta-propeller protein